MGTKQDDILQAPETASSPTGGGLQRIHSDDLLHGHRRLIIQHRAEEYCLQVTRNQRLILTKF